MRDLREELTVCVAHSALTLPWGNDFRARRGVRAEMECTRPPSVTGGDSFPTFCTRKAFRVGIMCGGSLLVASLPGGKWVLCGVSYTRSPRLAAARSRSGSESRLGFHSIPERRFATRYAGAPSRREPMGSLRFRRWGNGVCARRGRLCGNGVHAGSFSHLR